MDARLFFHGATLLAFTAVMPSCSSPAATPIGNSSETEPLRKLGPTEILGPIDYGQTKVGVCAAQQYEAFQFTGHKLQDGGVEDDQVTAQAQASDDPSASVRVWIVDSNFSTVQTAIGSVSAEINAASEYYVVARRTDLAADVLSISLNAVQESRFQFPQSMVVGKPFNAPLRCTTTAAPDTFLFTANFTLLPPLPGAGPTGDLQLTFVGDQYDGSENIPAIGEAVREMCDPVNGSPFTLETQLNRGSQQWIKIVSESSSAITIVNLADPPALLTLQSTQGQLRIHAELQSGGLPKPYVSCDSQ